MQKQGFTLVSVQEPDLMSSDPARSLFGNAKQHDVRIVKVFREEGVPGAKETMDRPAWVEMMTALHANGVKSIIIERLDRLARELMPRLSTAILIGPHTS